MQIGSVVINPGFIYAYYALCFTYVAMRFGAIGRKGNALANDMSLAIGFFALALGTVAVGLLFFAGKPEGAAFIVKILGFGAWYTAMVASAPLFTKLVTPKAPPLLIAAIMAAFGIGMSAYHLTHLTPLHISSDGLPLWDVPALVTLLHGIVTITYFTIIGMSYAYKAASSGHAARGFTFGAGCVLSALFMPLTYAINSRDVFTVMTVACILGQTILALSLWSNLLSLRSFRYDNDLSEDLKN